MTTDKDIALIRIESRLSVLYDIEKQIKHVMASSTDFEVRDRIIYIYREKLRMIEFWEKERHNVLHESKHKG